MRKIPSRGKRGMFRGSDSERRTFFRRAPKGAEKKREKRKWSPFNETSHKRRKKIDRGGDYFSRERKRGTGKLFLFRRRDGKAFAQLQPLVGGEKKRTRPSFDKGKGWGPRYSFLREPWEGRGGGEGTSPNQIAGEGTIPRHQDAGPKKMKEREMREALSVISVQEGVKRCPLEET